MSNGADWHSSSATRVKIPSLPPHSVGFPFSILSWQEILEELNKISERAKKMGHVYVDVVIKGRKEVPLGSVLVDTGATRTYLPKSMLEEAEAEKRPRRVWVELGDGRKVEAECYIARIEVEGREEENFILTFEGVLPAIGAETLEVLGLKVNPVTRKLEPHRPKGIMFR